MPGTQLQDIRGTSRAEDGGGADGGSGGPPRLRVLGPRAGYGKHGLAPRRTALRAGRRPATEREWGAEPESLWGTVGAPDPVTALDAAATLTILCSA